MTQEEKAKRYDEAIERARAFNNGEDFNIEVDTTLCEYIFPELKENKDEKIKRILHSIASKMSFYVCNIFTEEEFQCFDAWSNAWLEKQDNFSKKDVDDAYLKGVTDTKKEIEKQYEANYQIRKDIATFLFNYKGDIKDRAKWMNYLGIKVSFVEKHGEKPHGKSALEAINEEKVDNQNCVKPIDKVEPKFKIGDWITNGEYTWKVISVDYLDYTLQNQWGECVEDTVDYVNKTFHLWTIQDAKDGDVLAFDNGTIVIFKDLYNSTSFHSYCYIECGIFDFNKDELPDWWEGEGFNPATKEQSDILFQKIKEAGYEWDADKKELRKEEVK